MDKSEACKTPIQDLLRAIPKDLVIQFETKEGLTIWHNCPIGREAHEAAAEIERLQAELLRHQDLYLQAVAGRQEFRTECAALHQKVAELEPKP